jgi:hypothetical protein
VSAPPEEFTWALYAEYLDLAASEGYRFAGFQELRDDGEDHDEAIIHVRHDVDFALRWVLPMAELESRHGARSTYCLLLDSPYYSSAGAEFDETVRGVLDLGHWLGLHFDATAIAADDEVARRVGQAAASLGERFDTEVVAVSFHMPGRRSVSQIVLPGRLVNTYGPRFFTEIAYASDSNMDWRGTDVAELLRSHVAQRLQLLIHPVWWRASYMPMLDKLKELARDLGISLDELMTAEQRALIDSPA